MKPKYLGLLFIVISNLYNFFIPKNENCVMINYGGYSGFWYYYGNLQKNYLLNKKIYCYSSGCLATIANIQHNNHNSILKIVKILKYKYNNNIIDKFEIRNEFIYKISEKITDMKYYNINILTSNYYGNCNIIRPRNKKELIDALNMTTSIPYITSKLNITQNINGAFCLNKYPKCKDNILLPKKIYFYVNIFNYNLNSKDIDYFMNF